MQDAQKSRSARPQQAKSHTLRYVESTKRCENDAGEIFQHLLVFDLCLGNVAYHH